MEAVLQFTVTNQEIERTDEFVVVEGSDNYLQAHFTFTTSDWDGMVKTGIFIDDSGDVHPSLCTDDVCDVPSEWLKSQKGAVSVIGSDGVTKITTRPATVRIKEKGYIGNGVDDEEAGAYYDQIMQAFAETIAQTGKDAETASAAEKSAEGWAHGREDYPERAEDNAMYYAGKAQENSASAGRSLAGAQVAAEAAVAAKISAEASEQSAAELNEQAQKAAENALQSEQNAKDSEEAAASRAAAAEAAVVQAKSFAQQADSSKIAAEQAKTLVLEAEQKVAENKTAVEQVAADFAALHKQAVADVNNAGETQIERVKTTGDTQVKAINETGVYRKQEIEAAGVTQVNTINDAGTVQVSEIAQEGETQVANVQKAAAEIAGDREQITANTAALGGLSFSANEEKNCLQVTYGE